MRSLLLIKKGDKKYSEIRIEDKKYSIRNLGNGKSLLMKLDTESFPNESFCGNGSSADNISAQNSRH